MLGPYRPPEFNRNWSYDTNIFLYIKIKWSRYRYGMALGVVRGIALIFHDRGTRSGWVVSSTPRPNFTLGISSTRFKETGWVSGPVWTGGKSRPHCDSIPDPPSRSQSLYRLSYLVLPHTHTYTGLHILMNESSIEVWKENPTKCSRYL